MYGDTNSTKLPIEGTLWDAVGLKYDLRVICPDRSGSGLSSHDLKRTILSSPADILELAAHLDVSQFRVLSVSGGPYAFAGLKNLPAEKCLGGQIISAINPLSFGTKGMSLSRRAVMFFVLDTWNP